MRKRSATKLRERAADMPRRGPRTADLELQVGALRDVVSDMQRTLDTQFQRIAAIQAQLDHLTAKREGR